MTEPAKPALALDFTAFDPDIRVQDDLYRHVNGRWLRDAEIPPDDDERHLPRARFHAQLARDFGPAEAVEPLYLRVPDADRTRST